MTTENHLLKGMRYNPWYYSICSMYFSSTILKKQLIFSKVHVGDKTHGMLFWEGQQMYLYLQFGTLYLEYEQYSPMITFIALY